MQSGQFEFGAEECVFYTFYIFNPTLFQTYSSDRISYSYPLISDFSNTFPGFGTLFQSLSQKDPHAFTHLQKQRRSKTIPRRAATSSKLV